MAASRSHAPSSHARLHRRGNSASSMTRPLSPVADLGAFTFNRPESPQLTCDDPLPPQPPMPAVSPPPPPPPSSSSHPLKIKPYLRKLSSKDQSYTLDLSRPAAENESLAGLGISDYGGPARSVTDVNFAPVSGRSRHARSTSNTSHFSTSSRPTAPYLPPIRQTPQPYTPPLSKSTPPSILGSETEGDDIMTDEEIRLRQNAFDPARRSGSVSSELPGAAAQPLHIHTSGSSTRLGGSYSQSSLSLASPPPGNARPRGDTLKSIDTTSPSSRTSFDKAFGFIRGGRDSPVDAASRAASIRAARQAFHEKEQAKERKYDKEAHKQAERDNRKQVKKEERHRRQSEAEDRKGRSISDSNNERSTPRPSVGGRQYSDYRQAHKLTLPNHVVSVDPEKQKGVAPKVTKTRAAKSRWLQFITWLKTRLLRLSGKVSVRS